ncbi:alpha/beta hydrolase [Niabella beijingensis]|uniref:alpha/beta hydrolase n=1 Tax=Niabella beijingensis TaxID=2872700 RepID=UPI001CBA97D1|nr:alpha/beta hydrolase [Niabella beijingensis]MBZ4188731.1 alpha/beta hydrolase [Niabella beijingensis]
MITKIKHGVLASFFFLGTCWCSGQETAAVKKVIYPQGYSEQLNLVYVKAGDWEGRMDIYLPAKEKGPAPVVINIHGGGWNKGNKESQTGFSTFFKKGYAVVNVEYRLSQQATAPAAVQDVRCALIYLVNNAKELNIDVNRIVVMGGSAGGHLALVAGLMGNDNRFDGNCPAKQPVKIAAIVDKYGITDVKVWQSKSAGMWLGPKADDLEFSRSVSPLYLVKKNSPPVFIVHGDADPIVPYQQSVDLKKKLDEAGVKNRFITVPGGQHGKFEKEANSRVNNEIIAFLKEIGIHQ